jgi:hypothetical protein
MFHRTGAAIHSTPSSFTPLEETSMKQQPDILDDYSRPAPPPFPKELALKIARKVATLTQTFEDRALDQLLRDAQRAL